MGGKHITRNRLSPTMVEALLYLYALHEDPDSDGFWDPSMDEGFRIRSNTVAKLEEYGLAHNLPKIGDNPRLECNVVRITLGGIAEVREEILSGKREDYQAVARRFEERGVQAGAELPQAG